MHNRIVKILPLLVIPISLLFSKEPTDSNQGKQTHVQQNMLQNLETIHNSFDVMYAPFEWKKEYADWELDKHINHAKQKVLANPKISVKEFQRIVRDFLNTTQDYHVGVRFYSTESASLPFRVKSANGRYFVSWIDTLNTPEIEQIINIGDELLTFDGRPVDEVVQQIKREEYGNPDSKTDQSLAEATLTGRAGKLAHYVPQGSVETWFKLKNGSGYAQVTFEWDYHPELISSPLESPVAKLEMSPLNALKNRDMSTHLTEPMNEPFLKRGNDLEERNSLLGAKKSFLPDLGQIIWRAPKNSHFDAYIFKTAENKLVGFIRIPTFMADTDEATQFNRIISIFQKKTDALVIDQMSNGGGRLFYMYALASSLTDTQLVVPSERMRISQAEAFDFLMLLSLIELNGDSLGTDNLCGFFFDESIVQKIKDFLLFTLNQWNEGKNLTDPCCMFGIDAIHPHPKGQYSKPILILVNSLDFSCADFFPAIMQDNKRAVIMGEKTAGAGGCVTAFQFPNNLGISDVRFTNSIAYRNGQTPIENLGITPDVPYEFTENDLQNNYKDFAQAIRETLKTMLKK